MNTGRLLRIPLAAVLIGLVAAPLALGQGSHRDYDEHFDEANVTVPPEYYEEMSFRAVGFTRGGRSTAAVGVPGDPLAYYFGGTGGGVFKTSDAGHNWTNVSDGFFGVGAVGAIAVAPSDVNVVYVGTGSACPRGNISVGDGMYRSTDAGKTWEHVGLRHAGQIGAIVSIRTIRTSPMPRRSATSSGRTRTAASSARGTVARPGTRCSSFLTAPGSWTSRWTRTTRASSTLAPGARRGSPGP